VSTTIDATAAGLEIRELAACERACLRFVFARMGERSRHQRFLGFKKQLSDRELAALASVDHWHREALVAFTRAPRTPVGVARYERRARFDRAELAVAVVDAHQREGVGRALVDELSRRALAAGIRGFGFTTLAENRAAFALAREIGPLRRVASDAGVTQMLVEIAHTRRRDGPSGSRNAPTTR
jgi:RimJ/RimL family protein N-acetyltransferase